MVTILAPDFRLGGVEREATQLNTLTYYSDMTLDSFNPAMTSLPRMRWRGLPVP